MVSEKCREELFDVAIPLLKAETQESQSREVGSFSICTTYIYIYILGMAQTFKRIQNH